MKGSSSASKSGSAVATPSKKAKSVAVADVDEQGPSGELVPATTIDTSNWPLLLKVCLHQIM